MASEREDTEDAKILMKIVGRGLNGLSLLLLASITYSFFSVLLLKIAGESTTALIGHGCFGIFMMFNIVFNYCLAVTRHPGSPPTDLSVCLQP